jgi:hypothetical protein
LELRSRDKSFTNPEISEGIVPDKPIEGREIAVTTVEEQVRPLQTVGEHLLATLAQIHEGESDWILVDEMKEHKASFILEVGDRVGLVVGDTLGFLVGDTVGQWRGKGTKHTRAR